MKLDDLGLNGKSIPEVYVDMDGVLADFFGEWARLDSKDHYKDIDNPEAKLQLVREHPTFWLDLPVLPNAGKLLGFIKKNIGFYKICSSPLAGDPNSEPHKRIWIKKHLSAFPPTDVIITSNKAAYAVQFDGTPNILIDDFGKNIKKWNEAGGIGIKHKDYKLERTLINLRSVFSHQAFSA
jgi:5'(3')-deoxyribonucleotidase